MPFGHVCRKHGHAKEKAVHVPCPACTLCRQGACPVLQHGERVLERYEAVQGLYTMSRATLYAHTQHGKNTRTSPQRQTPFAIGSTNMTCNLWRAEAHRAVRGVPCGSAMSMAATSSSAMLTSTPGDAGGGRRAADATARPMCRATSVFDLIQC